MRGVVFALGIVLTMAVAIVVGVQLYKFGHPWFALGWWCFIIGMVRAVFKEAQKP